MNHFFRLKLAFHVLRGKPLAYRLNIEGGITLRSGEDAIIAECNFLRGRLYAEQSPPTLRRCMFRRLDDAPIEKHFSNN